MEEIKVFKDPEFVLSKKILWALRSNGFTSAIVEGPRGIGKSSYALKVFHDAFRCLGYNDDAAWDMAMDRILYRINDIITFLDKSTRKHKPELGFIWDDAAVFGSNMVWWLDIKKVHLLQSMLDTVRGSVNSMILTCPSQMQLLKFLRRYDSHIVRITYTSAGGTSRCAKGYIWRSLPSGTQRIYPSYVDNYSCHLPTDVYKRYQRKRKQYNKENITALREALQENINKEEIEATLENIGLQEDHMNDNGQEETEET